MNLTRVALLLCFSSTIASKAYTQTVIDRPAEVDAADVLSSEQWGRVDTSVERALAWLVGRQQRDGSFPAIPQGQPGVTSLCTLALMAHGHLPGEGKYGTSVERAIDYVASCQKENGLLAVYAPRGARIHRNVSHAMGGTSVYNHAISSLLLSEAYAMSGPRRTAQLQPVIEKSIKIILTMQRWPKQNAGDQGGWRYMNRFEAVDSDVSLTGWNLMFLRSAKNAGFDVPQPPIDNAVAYIRRCYNPKYGVFEYEISRVDRRSRAMAGAGVLALAHAGFHNSEEARKSGDWILRHHFDRYNEIARFDQRSHVKDRYHYSAFNCSQAMYQLGGRHWQEFFPRLVSTLLQNQNAEGSWPAERHYGDAKFGNAYTTALVVLTLGAPNQILPVFQR